MKLLIFNFIFFFISCNSKAASNQNLIDVNFYRTIFEVISEGFIEPINEEEFIYNSLNGGLQGIDPHSAYIPPKEYAKFKEGINGEFSGIGIQITSESGFIKVISPIDNTPAFNGGVRAGDYITHIDGENVYQISIEEAAIKMRGKAGTNVKLSILRSGEEKPLEISLIREKIKSKSVTVKIEGDIGIIRIASFTGNTGLEVRDVILQMKDKIKGIILDLRNNPGGLMDQSILISNFFLDKGVKIVSVKSKRKNETFSIKEAPKNPFAFFPICIKDKECVNFKIKQEEGETTFFSTGQNIIDKDIPIITLINQGSASASEIVAGALKDNQRSIILGEVSFGKGVVQTILPVYNGDKGAIKLTTSRYYTPSGASIQAAGIIPNIIIEDTKIIETKEVKFKNIFFQREENLKNHAIPEKLQEIAKQSKKYNAKKDLINSYTSDFQMFNSLMIMEGLILHNLSSCKKNSK